MRTNTKILARTIILAAAGWIAACNGHTDKEPDVVLEVGTLTIPPITASTQNGVCTFTITNATATLNNKPKNHLADTSPFNDIVMSNVDISYVWDDPLAATTPVQVFGIGATIPAGGSGGATFSVVNNEVLQSAANPPRDGHTASLVLTFHGTTVSGQPVQATSGGSVLVNSCVAEAVGACCTGVAPGACSDLTQTNCTALGGAVFQGNLTTCATTTCP
jgi:hypothetical protein